MKKIILVVLMVLGGGVALAEQTSRQMIEGAITRPWPGKNYPELPSLPDGVVSNVMTEIESTPAIREAYAKLNAATQRNVTWFEGVAELEKQKAVWSLLSCLCHPHDDVQIYALRALARVKDERTLPFLLQYASAMAVFEGGSENATIHGIIHDETAKTLSAITSLDFKMRGGQDPEGLKAAVATATKWLNEKTKKVPSGSRGVISSPLPHHRTCGSASGGSEGLLRRGGYPGLICCRVMKRDPDVSRRDQAL